MAHQEYFNLLEVGNGKGTHIIGGRDARITDYEFYKYYALSLSMGEKSSEIISEYVEDTSPFRLCLEGIFSAQGEAFDNPFVEEIFLKTLVSLVQTQLSNNFLFLTEDMVENTCIILANDIDTTQNVHTCKLVLHFPYAVIPIAEWQGLVTNIIRVMNEKKLELLLTCVPVQGCSGMFRWSNVITMEPPKFISMYGLDDVKYTTTFIKSGNALLESCLEDIYTSTYLSFDDIQFDDISADNLLPLILSQRYCRYVLAKKTDSRPVTPIAEIGEETSSIPPDFCASSIAQMADTSDPIALARYFSTMLDQVRFTRENYARDIGRIFSSLTYGSNRGRSIWISIMKDNLVDTTPEYTKGKDITTWCIQEYRKMTGDLELTEKTLAWYASIDNPTRYATWHKAWCIEKMKEAAIMQKSVPIADAFYRTFWLEYVYDPIDCIWYRFEDHGWKHDHKKKIELGLREDFLKKFTALDIDLGRAIHAGADNVDEISKIKAGCEKVRGILMDQRSLKSILDAAKPLFSREDLSDTINSNPAYLRFPNGVIEAMPKSIFFRPGKPEDWVSLMAPYHFATDLTWESPDVVFIMDWFSKVYQIKEKRDYVIRFFSSCIRGGNLEKIVAFFLGESGDNSKSMIILLLEAAFGSLVQKCPTALLKDVNNDAGKPTPSLMALAMKRIGIFDESGKSVNANDVKKLSGGDKLPMRGLFKSQAKSREISAKLIMVGNKMGEMLDRDRAGMGRMVQITHNSRWSSNAPKDPKEQEEQHHYPVDRNFREKIPAYAPAFMWILFQIYPEYANGDKKIPECILKDTVKHWENTDVYKIFCNTFVYESAGSTLSVDTAYRHFKVWMKEYHGDKRVQNLIDAKKEMERVLGPLCELPSASYWQGLTIDTLDGYAIPIGSTKEDTRQYMTNRSRSRSRGRSATRNINNRRRRNVESSKDKNTVASSILTGQPCDNIEENNVEYTASNRYSIMEV